MSPTGVKTLFLTRHGEIASRARKVVENETTSYLGNGYDYGDQYHHLQYVTMIMVMVISIIISNMWL